MEKSVPRRDIVVKCPLRQMVKSFFEDFVVVWHDPNLNSEENRQYTVLIERLCKVETFTDWEKASIFIRKTDRKHHVITSGTNGEFLTREIDKNENVSSIYIFCRNQDYHSTWAKNYQKISCVKTEIGEILDKIEQGLLEWYKQESSRKLNLPAFAPIFNDTHKSQMNSLHLRLRAIPSFQNRELAQNDFAALSREIYSDKTSRKDIAEFEQNYHEYNMEQILKWYTRESFMYRVVNNSLRIGTSDSMQYCRLPLRDIQKAIQEKYHMQSKSFNGLLYRGTYLSENEWSSLKENEGKEIEMNGFMSASKEKNVALKFILSDGDLSQKIFITIIVPKGSNEEEQGFAEVEEFSKYPQEKEILFNVRSRFTVLKTEDKYSEEIPSRHLVLLYGAQGFRKFVAEKNPVQEVSISKHILCAHCKVLGRAEKMLFIPLTDLQNCKFYCKGCLSTLTGSAAHSFLCVPIVNNPASKKSSQAHSIKLKGFSLMKGELKIPFYGYQCAKCQAEKKESYVVCTDCDKGRNKWCRDCVEGASRCLIAGHTMILESNPFSFWSEKMTKEELNDLNIQKESVFEGDVFQQAQMYSQSHEYEKAIKYYLDFIHQNEGNGNTVELAESWNNLGKVYLDQGKYNEAYGCFEQSLDISNSLCGEKQSHLADLFNNLSRVHKRHGNRQKAIECLNKSLEIKKLVYEDHQHSTIAASYNNIGNLYKDQGNNKKAKESYLKSLKIYKAVYGDMHLHVATSYDNLGIICSSQGENEKALEYYEIALQIRKSVHGENHSDMASSYNNIADLCHNQGQNGKALEYYLKALDINHFIHRENQNHPDLADSYSNIGLVFDSQGDFLGALEYFLKSLDIREIVHGKIHTDVANSYLNIGNTYQRQGENQKAIENLLKSMEIYKQVHQDNQNHPDLATSYHYLRLAYCEHGEYHEALEYHQKSLKIRSLICEKNHPDLAHSFHGLALAHQNQGDNQKALYYFQQSLKIRKSLYGENHADVATSFRSIGAFYTKLEDNEKATEYLLKSLKISSSIYGEKHSDVASAYTDLGNICLKQGEVEEAQKYYSKSLDITKSLYGEDHPNIALSYCNLGNVYSYQNELKKAQEYHERSLHILESFCQENHRKIASTSYYLAMDYETLGDNAKALEHYRKSLRIYTSIYGEDDDMTIKCQNKVNQLEQNRYFWFW